MNTDPQKPASSQDGQPAPETRGAGWVVLILGGLMALIFVVDYIKTKL